MDEKRVHNLFGGFKMQLMVNLSCFGAIAESVVLLQPPFICAF